MASTKYTYSIAGDTAAGKANGDSLTNEIAASAIVTALDYINVSVDGADVLDVWMKAALSTGDETILDGVVAAHEGDPVIEVLPIDYSTQHDAQNIPVVALSAYAYAAETTTWHGSGSVGVALANAQTFFDTEITTQIYAQSGFYWAQDITVGDVMEFSVIDKNDVLGLFSTYGLTVGVDVLELKKYVDDVCVVPELGPNNTYDGRYYFEAKKAALLLPGLFIRGAYTNTHATKDVNVIYHYGWYVP